MASFSYSSWSSLTEDILIDIFTYLPLDSVYRCKSVSKVWLSILSNPNFITGWIQINQKSLPWILYHTITDIIGDKNPLKFRNAYPDSHSGFMSRDEYLFSFKFLINEKPFQGTDLYLLGSNNGLVLCYSVHSDDLNRYHVCNPLTQKWVSLPLPPRPEASQSYVNGIFCEHSSSLASCFKVVRIPKFCRPSKKFIVDVFSSDFGVWESFEVSCDEDVEWYRSEYENVVILNGVLFWIEGGDRMLVYNINQHNGSDGHQCSLIYLPDDGFDDSEFCDFNNRISESEGLVCYAKTGCTGREMAISVWVLDDNVNWQILHENISIGDILEEVLSRIGEDAPIQVLGFSPVDRNVILLGWNHWVWGINIQTRSIEQLCLDNRRVYSGAMFLPFVLKPMPTVIPPQSWMVT